MTRALVPPRLPACLPAHLPACLSAALELIRRAGNVTMSLTMSAIVPLTVMAFAAPLPFLPPSPPLGPLFVLGTTFLLGGLLMYNAPLWLPAAMKASRAWATAAASKGE